LVKEVTFLKEGLMGFPEVERRLRSTSVWVLILVVGFILVPGILANIWLKFQSFASTRFEPSGLQTIAIVVVIVGVGGWILLGLLKED